MDQIIYLLLVAVVACVQAFPLPLVARVGRWGGGLAYYLDSRHRRVAIRNLTMCFGAEKPPMEIRALARENFRRLGENYLASIKTAVMTPEEMQPHFDFVGAEKVLPYGATKGPQSRIMAIGHFGNFELYARFGQFVPHFKCGATYRGFRQPSLNRILQSLRSQSGCHFFERRSDAAALKACMADTGMILGLLVDQHAALGSVRLPFFGQDCSTSVAAAVFALRYDCPLHTAICYRVGLARWRIEVGDEISTREAGRPRTTEAIMADVNQEFELTIRRDPANWFWVHRRWKPAKAKLA